MDSSTPFSVLNERLRPRYTTSEQLYSSLSRVSSRSYFSYRPSVFSMQPAPRFSVTDAEEDAAQEDSVSDSVEEENCGDVLPGNNSVLISELNVKDEGDEDGSFTQSEEKDSSGDLTSEGTDDSSGSVSLSDEGGNSFQRNYLDRTLPDLINSGRPLGRRRTLGHVTNTLNEVRREVELSRKRSIKLKAQVDKLQEKREGQGWSQHRERVKDEVLSILRLLHPLTEPESTPPEPAHGENPLDAALAQLQNVARKLAVGHTQQEAKCGKGAEDSSILQQALRDRDEAIEKKKAMEAELLRSKTELMMLNNQLLEAAQKRLELSLELEAWKEDVQLILNQQLQLQQQAELAQKKPSRMGLLRRHNKPPIQRPSTIPSSAPIPPTTNSNQIFLTKSSAPPAPAPTTPSTGTQRWKDKLKRGKIGRQGDQDSTETGKQTDGFQVISLD